MKFSGGRRFCARFRIVFLTRILSNESVEAQIALRRCMGNDDWNARTHQAYIVHLTQSA
jgi:hypothetical protein